MESALYCCRCERFEKPWTVSVCEPCVKVIISATRGGTEEGMAHALVFLHQLILEQNEVFKELTSCFISELLPKLL